jgi:hypothetical protein
MVRPLLTDPDVCHRLAVWLARVTPGFVARDLYRLCQLATHHTIMRCESDDSFLIDNTGSDISHSTVVMHWNDFGTALQTVRLSVQQVTLASLSFHPNAIKPWVGKP